jgi:hypothetical protein
MAVPIRILGVDISGKQFAEDTHTIVISRHGATVALKVRLGAQQDVMIRSSWTGKEASARVVGVIAEKSDICVYAMCAVDAAINLWRIGFPPPESEKAVARLLMECDLCRNREVACLGELETEVFRSESGYHAILHSMC